MVKKEKLKILTLIASLFVMLLCFSIQNIGVFAQSPTLPVSEEIFDSTQEHSYAPTTYKVQSGDSMWKIAVRYEIGLAELLKANPQIKDPTKIFVGQTIYIPEGAPLKTLEDEVLRLVNVERAKNGLMALKYNWQAARVARTKSQDMINNNYFNHISPVYGSPFKMLESYGLKFSAAAENIAYGQRTAAEVMNSWMNSPGHKANILGKSCTEIGVGAAKNSNGTLYWTQLFLKPI